MAGELGPNGAMVERFLERLPEVGLAQWGDVVRSWRDTLRRTDEWAGAEDAVGDAIARTGRHDAQCDLQDRLYLLCKRSPWFTTGAAPGAAAGTEAAAHYLASTAAFALLVADALPREALRALYAPFAATIPLPELALPGEYRRGRAGRVDDLPAA
jgi:hypothetical protein